MAKVINVAEINSLAAENGQKSDSSSPNRQIEKSKQPNGNLIDTIDKNRIQPKEILQNSHKDITQRKLEDDNKDKKNQTFDESTPKIIPISDVRQPDLAEEVAGNLNSYLHSEKRLHEEKAQSRKELFESIIQNEPTKFSSTDLLFYPFAIILVGFLVLVPFCFFPAHDLIIRPEYWYELLAHGTYFTIFNSLFWTYMSGSFLNLSYFHQARPLIVTILAGVMATLLFIIISYSIWTQALFYQYPIPHSAPMSSIVTYLVLFTTIWYLVPNELKKRRSVLRRLKFVYCYAFVAIYVVFVYLILAQLIRNFRGPYQPLIGLMFPVTRELAIWIATKIMRNCVNGDEEGSLIVMSYALNVNHSIILSYIIGSATDNITSSLLMAIDFLVNMYLCLRLVWVKYRNYTRLDDLTKLLRELAVAEIVEFQAPLGFILVTSLAYNSPVGAIIGNISNSYWTYQAIDDINETLTRMSVFLLVDFTSTLVSATILWLACKINLLNMFIVLQKEFFTAFSLTLGYLLLVVSTVFEINYDRLC